MTIQTLFFVQLAEATGQSATTIELPPRSSVGALLSILADRHDRLGPLLPSIAVAVNEKYATLDQILQDGDTVALIPPVSGG